MVSPAPEVEVQDAATLILVRDPLDGPRILLGRRQRNAVFMAGVMVFPGGAVDAEDADVALSGGLPPALADHLSDGAAPASAYPAAAIRELWEETGLVYGAAGEMAPVPPGWEGFAAKGALPRAEGLALIFRAITPPGQVRRYDARFFIADAKGLWGDIDDFSGASGELTELRWVPVAELPTLDLAPVTRVVLTHVLQRLPDLSQPETVPLRRPGKI
ncbi:MAG: NUDIX hydrolase [Pseudomonadota bacterium]